MTNTNIITLSVRNLESRDTNNKCIISYQPVSSISGPLEALQDVSRRLQQPHWDTRHLHSQSSSQQPPEACNSVATFCLCSVIELEPQCKQHGITSIDRTDEIAAGLTYICFCISILLTQGNDFLYCPRSGSCQGHGLALSSITPAQHQSNTGQVSTEV